MEGVANSSDTNTTAILDGTASCCNLWRERETDEYLSVFVVRLWWWVIQGEIYTKYYCECCECLVEGNIGMD
jgi:hypothetical protein